MFPGATHKMYYPVYSQAHKSIKHDECTLISWAQLSPVRQDNTRTPYIIYRRFRPYRRGGKKTSSGLYNPL